MRKRTRIRTGTKIRLNIRTRTRTGTRIRTRTGNRMRTRTRIVSRLKLQENHNQSSIYGRLRLLCLGYCSLQSKCTLAPPTGQKDACGKWTVLIYTWSWPVTLIGSGFGKLHPLAVWRRNFDRKYRWKDELVSGQKRSCFNNKDRIY